MKKVLGEKFFKRDPATVARALLGKYLVRKNGAKIRRFKITETEAYLGSEDLASHARHGKTARNAPMHGPPGRWYVYLVYGLHHLLNIVTGPEGEASAVLIRGVAGFPRPAVLTKALGIERTLTAQPATRESGLWIEDWGEKVGVITAGPRIGIEYAGTWAKKPLRFILSK